MACAAIGIYAGVVFDVRRSTFDVRRLTDWDNDLISILRNDAVCAALTGLGVSLSPSVAGAARASPG